MRALAAIFGMSRLDAVRWSACFVVVLAAHASAAMALLLNVPAASESGIDAPVVMLDLPESLLPSPTPTADLPPGPMQQFSPGYGSAPFTGFKPALRDFPGTSLNSLPGCVICIFTRSRVV